MKFTCEKIDAPNPVRGSQYVVRGDGIDLLTISGLTAKESGEELAKLMTGVYNMGRSNPAILNPFSVSGQSIVCRGVSLGAKVPFVSPLSTAGLLNLAYALGAGRLKGVTRRSEVKKILSGYQKVKTVSAAA
jgi:hypothetical protein